MNKQILIIGFILLSFNLFAQDSYTMKGKYTGTVFPPKVYLSEYYGTRISRIDSVVVNKDGQFEFRLAASKMVGMYSINVGYGVMLDLLFNRENIDFTFNNVDAINTVNFSESVENKIYYEYLKLNKKLTEEIYALKRKDARSKQIVELELSKYNQSLKLVADNPNTLAAKVIKSDIVPHSPDFEKNYYEPNATILEDQFLKENYFSLAEFSDERLIRMSTLQSKINIYHARYLQNVSNEFFQTVITKIMDKARMNGLVNDMILRQFIAKIEHDENFELLDWLQKTYPFAEVCEDEMYPRMIRNNIEAMKKLKAGNTAPDFTLKDMSGNDVTLSKIKAEKLLIVFWKTTCSHCMATMPELKAFYEENHAKGLEILTVSLDHKKENWQTAVSSGGYKWLNIWHLSNPAVQITSMYHLQFTPKFYYLDENKTIIGKFNDFQSFKTAWQQMK